MSEPMHCPKCDADISESYQPEESDVGISEGWYCDACDLAVAGWEHPREPMEGDVDIFASSRSEPISESAPEHTRCPAHPDALPEMGYGLAGGGVGLYSYCPVCSRIVHKTQDHDSTSGAAGRLDASSTRAAAARQNPKGPTMMNRQRIYRAADTGGAVAGGEQQGGEQQGSQAVTDLAGSQQPVTDPPARTPATAESSMRAQAKANTALSRFLEALENAGPHMNIPGGVLELGVAAQACLTEATRQIEEVCGPKA